MEPRPSNYVLSARIESTASGVSFLPSFLNFFRSVLSDRPAVEGAACVFPATSWGGPAGRWPRPPLQPPHTAPQGWPHPSWRQGLCTPHFGAWHTHIHFHLGNLHSHFTYPPKHLFLRETCPESPRVNAYPNCFSLRTDTLRRLGSEQDTLAVHSVWRQSGGTLALRRVNHLTSGSSTFRLKETRWE